MPRPTNAQMPLRSPTLSIVALFLVLIAFMPAEAARLQRGSPPPDVTWMTAGGDTLSWGDLRGDAPLVLVFWASWCKVCRKDWPKLGKIASRYEQAATPPVWAPVNLGEAPARARKVAAEWELPGLLLVDPDEHAAKTMGVRFVPTVCILDSNGDIAYAGKPDAKKIDRLLQSLSNPPPPEDTSP